MPRTMDWTGSNTGSIGILCRIWWWQSCGEWSNCDRSTFSGFYVGYGGDSLLGEWNNCDRSTFLALLYPGYVTQELLPVHNCLDGVLEWIIVGPD